MVLLSSCTQISGLGKARQKESLKNPFYDALHSGYLALANQAQTTGNEQDARNYNKKAMLLVGNIMPEPETLADKQISPAHLQSLAVARTFVIETIIKDVQRNSPIAVANLQLMFDCWVRQENNDLEIHDDYPCKKSYLTEEQKIKTIISANANKEIDVTEQAALATPIKEAAKPVELQNSAPEQTIISDSLIPEQYEIFFQLGHAELDKLARQMLLKTAMNATKIMPRKILINGNTDRSGTLQGNAELATKRANAVAKFLMNKGVPENILDIRSYGESAAWIDQVPEDKDERYRSVKIIFLKDNKIHYR